MRDLKGNFVCKGFFRKTHAPLYFNPDPSKYFILVKDEIEESDLDLISRVLTEDQISAIRDKRASLVAKGMCSFDSCDLLKKIKTRDHG